MLSLKNVLLINGTTSGITGAALTLLSNFIAGIFGVSGSGAFWAVGLFLVTFAALVISEGLRSTLNARRVQLIILLDVSWVVVSVLILVLQLFEISLIGNILIAAVAAWVALMAVLQIQGLKALTRG